MRSNKLLTNTLAIVLSLNCLESKLSTASNKDAKPEIQPHYQDERRLYEDYLKIEEKFVKKGNDILGYRIDDISKKISGLYSLLIELNQSEHCYNNSTLSIDELYGLYDETMNKIILQSLQNIFLQPRTGVNYPNKIKEIGINQESKISLALYQATLDIIRARSKDLRYKSKNELNNTKAIYENFLKYVIEEQYLNKKQEFTSANKATIIRSAGLLTLFCIIYDGNEFKTKRIFKRFRESNEFNGCSLKNIRGFKMEDQLINTENFMRNLLKIKDH